MEHSSQVLDQSVQEVGKKLNIRVDEAGRSLEMSAEVSAKSIKEGAKEAKELLSNVGGDWSKSIQSASTSLRDSATEAGGVLSKSMLDVEGVLVASIERWNEEWAEKMRTHQDALQKVVEESSKANRDSGHLLLQSAQESSNVLQQSFTRWNEEWEDKMRTHQDTLQKVVEESSKANRDSGHLLLQSAQESSNVLQQSFTRWNEEWEEKNANTSRCSSKGR